MKFWLIFGIVFLILINIVSAVHYIIGQVNDAKDSTPADNRIITLWNPAVGISENLTDIIGALGNSGTNNTYMIDCDLLSACNIDDLLFLKVFDIQTGYITTTASVTVTGAVSDAAPALDLNTPPNISALSPGNNTNQSSPVLFNCSASDPDGNLKNITLYGNWSDGWHSNESISVSGSSASVQFTKDIPDGNYLWECVVYDDLNISGTTGNLTFRADTTPPNTDTIYLNSTEGCASNSIRTFCNISSNDVSTVIIRARNQSEFETNLTASLLIGETYYSDLIIDEYSNYSFNCWANDTAGNQNQTDWQNFSMLSLQPDIRFNTIAFSGTSISEGAIIQINATLLNYGCNSTGEFPVGFYLDDPDSGGTQINTNVSVSIPFQEYRTANMSWTVLIGKSNIFVKADVNNSAEESNESNNKYNQSLQTPSWMYLYGNATLQKILSISAFSNLSVWNNDSNILGNIFITAVDSQVSWGALQALGRNSSGSQTSDDFDELDSLLNTTDSEDSVKLVFTESNMPKLLKNITIYQKNISNIPAVNSTFNENFYTGILWDTQDSANEEFDSIEKEDIVFLTEINPGKQGQYGFYDYEIRIPAKLRSYRTEGQQSVYLYYELN